MTLRRRVVNGSVVAGTATVILACGSTPVPPTPKRSGVSTPSLTLTQKYLLAVAETNAASYTFLRQAKSLSPTATSADLEKLAAPFVSTLEQTDSAILRLPFPPKIAGRFEPRSTPISPSQAISTAPRHSMAAAFPHGCNKSHPTARRPSPCSISYGPTLDCRRTRRRLYSRHHGTCQTQRASPSPSRALRWHAESPSNSLRECHPVGTHGDAERCPPGATLCIQELEPTGRFELPASGLRNRCSTTELRRLERCCV